MKSIHREKAILHMKKALEALLDSIYSETQGVQDARVQICCALETLQGADDPENYPQRSGAV